MEIDYSNKKYYDAVEWIKIRKNKHKTKEELLLACKENIEKLNVFLEQQTENNDWPQISIIEWQGLVNYYFDLWERETACIIPETESISGISDRTAPNRMGTAWREYKDYLLESKNFSIPAVDNIERSVLDILNHLKHDTHNTDPIKGLVVGNVQSGKTANMEGLISMAADYGWNMFIILTGTIENLRKQTQERFNNDLKNGNLTWNLIEHLKSSSPHQLYNLRFGTEQRARYITCCLKNASRLRALKKWLNSDKNKKRQLRILLIDDEADQASINVNDIDEEERTTINQCIMDIVNNTNNDPKSHLSETENEAIQVPYLSMNYICYTATPYGNFLNETSNESLYPKDFISVLEPSDLYFGPQQIFGDTIWEGMPILNTISGDYKRGRIEEFGDIQKLNDVCEDYTLPLPQSLQDAIAWFCIAVSIQRIWKYKKPVTMLIHHTMKTEKHANLGKSILNWLKLSISDNDFLNLCERIYNIQTKQFTKETFSFVCNKYGLHSGINILNDIKTYPAFNLLKKYILELKQKIEHIPMREGETLNFHNGIHLCIDNCKNEAISQSNYVHVRLIYPNENNSYKGYAPAFLVIGGNTLSRGLTLEGLVCTYFSREVKQADSLMQMGRWFGFRRGYELLPRIWLTEMAQKRFEFLTELDSELRSDLYKYKSQVTPLEYGPLILNTPAITRMNVTNKNKSQSMISADMNFAGANLQTFYFYNNKEQLEKNLSITDTFIKLLSTPSTIDETKKVWENISFNIIWRNLLSTGFWNLSQLYDIHDFKLWYENMNRDGILDKWNVVLSGRKSKDVNSKWNGISKIFRTRKISGMNTANSNEICIGVLSDPKEWCLDLNGNFKNAISVKEQYEIRNKQGKGNIPLLVIYCIDKNSQPTKNTNSNTRMPLNAKADIIGLSIHIPGQKINKNFCSKITVNLNNIGE